MGSAFVYENGVCSSIGDAYLFENGRKHKFCNPRNSKIKN
jgi:hypothetical protein